MLVRSVESSEGLIVVYGLRRPGRTSLTYIALSELEVPFIPIDLRRHSEYPSLLTPSAMAHVVGSVLSQYERLGRIKKTVVRIVSYVDSLDLRVIRLKPRKERKLLTNILEKATNPKARSVHPCITASPTNTTPT